MDWIELTHKKIARRNRNNQTIRYVSMNRWIFRMIMTGVESEPELKYMQQKAIKWTKNKTAQEH